MAIKIGKYYITQNNPRELLRERAELINILDEIREYINNFLIYSDEDGELYFKEEFTTEYNEILQILDKVKVDENK